MEQTKVERGAAVLVEATGVATALCELGVEQFEQAADTPGLWGGGLLVCTVRHSVLFVFCFSLLFSCEKERVSACVDDAQGG